MIFSSTYYKTIPELNINLLQDIPIEEARKLAKFSQKNATPIYEDNRTANTLKAVKAFYTTFNRTHFLILVNQTNANVIPIPNIPLNSTWICYRHDLLNQWQWWSMGYGLPMMFESLVRNFNCTSFEITQNEIIGKNAKNQLFVLSPDEQSKTLPTMKIIDGTMDPKPTPKPIEKVVKKEAPNPPGIITNPIEKNTPMKNTKAVKPSAEKLSEKSEKLAEKIAERVSIRAKKPTKPITK